MLKIVGTSSLYHSLNSLLSVFPEIADEIVYSEPGLSLNPNSLPASTITSEARGT